MVTYRLSAPLKRGEDLLTKKIARALHGLRGEVVIPGDKSISHRSMILGGLAQGSVHIANYLQAADCLSTMEGMRLLGAEVAQQGDGSLLVTGTGLGRLREPEKIVDAGDSGTMLRLLMGALAPQPFLTTFTGDDSLSRRPMGRVIEPLKQMGAKIVGRDHDRLLPITILPTEKALQGITYEMPVASAQVKSAILLAGLWAEGETTVVEPIPSRDHTERMLEAFGVRVARKGRRVTVGRTAELYAPEYIEVPGDISSAAYWLVAASIVEKSDLLLKNVGINPSRTGILDILREMGADISSENERVSGGEPLADLRVRTAALHGVSFGASIMPRLIDEIPILAVAALFAAGDTVISGAEELRVKETDRLRAIAAEYNKIAPGAVTEQPDGLIIHGQMPLRQATGFSYHDHRIAMALAISGAAGDGIEIEHPDCVAISYPLFYETLADLGK